MTTAPQDARIANAPVSYGVFGTLTVDGAATPAELLRTMAADGFRGSELGPPGFFGDVQQTVEAFTTPGLAAVGAYVPLHTQDTGAVLERDLDRMRQTFAELEALGGGRVILADEGDDTLLANPRHRAELGLDDDGWSRLVGVVEAARAEAEDRGLRASFHPHIATYVEQPGEIQRLLDATDVSLTFDVAHVVLGGGDAVGDFRRWYERIDHIHVKDARLAVFEQAVRSGRADFDEWWSQLCTPLGEGDIELEAFLAECRRSGYDGWYVVEQDRAPLQPGDFPSVRATQKRNADWLASRVVG